MRELVILGSASITTPPPHHNHHHHHHSPKPKLKPSLHRHTISPRNSNSNSLVKHYSDTAANLAETGRLREFAALAESAVASGVEPSRFVASLSVKSVANGVLKNIREGNLVIIAEILEKVEKIGIIPVTLFDGAAMDLLKEECVRMVKKADVAQVVELLESLADFGLPINELVEPRDIVKICVDKSNPKMAMRYASLFPRERILLCDIINEFGKKRDLDSALTAYEVYKQSMSVPNMYVLRTIIDVCGLCGDHMKSRSIYEDLLNQNITPNIYVFNSLMNVNSFDLGYTLYLYRSMQKLGVTADVASYNILLKACCLAGRVDLAQEIYGEIKQLESIGLLKLDVFTYCTIIKVFADAKLWQMALKIKEDMLSAGVTPNMFTWSSLISACASAGLVEQAIQLFEEMLLAGCEPNSQCLNIILHACVEACQYDRAFRLFQFWKGSGSQGILGDNTSNIPRAEDAHQQLVTTVPNFMPNSPDVNFIKKIPFTPTSTTYNILMKACGSDYHRAKSLMDEMTVVGLSPNHISWTILIDICGASSNAEGALRILKNMRAAGVEPDVIAYTTAIKVCVESKKLKLAFSTFAEMKRYQIKPNLVTYNTLLRARTRYGSLKEVQQCLAVYQDMRKAGYKSNDYYLKQLIEEWCEGVIQDKDQRKHENASYRRTNLWRPHSPLLEKVAAHLQNSISESLAIGLQGLTKVEARIVVLAVLRMMKEKYASGHSVKDDMWITLGLNKVDMHLAKEQSGVRDAIQQLLQNELGLEVLHTVPRFTEKLVQNRKFVSSPRRPVVLERLKVTRQSLQHWLQRRVGTIRR